MPNSKRHGKMSVERARQMRDLERGMERAGLQDPHPGELKQRELRFDHARPEQVEEARLLLSGLEGLKVESGHHQDALMVHYDIREYTLQGLETALVRQGFHLDHSLVTQISRAIVYFCEDTQLRNMRQPERLIKKSNEIYSKAWDHHLHGDHDDTPPDLREER